MPTGVVYDTNGIPKAENQLTTTEKNTVILENQFVWMPIELKDYKKVDWGNGYSNATWKNTNFSLQNGLNHTAIGNITCKAGEIPYYHADYFTALILCNRMYENSKYIQSGLIASNPDNTVESYMGRGGSFYDDYVRRPACCRRPDTAGITRTQYGVRPALYIM